MKKHSKFVSLLALVSILSLGSCVSKANNKTSSATSSSQVTSTTTSSSSSSPSSSSTVEIPTEFDKLFKLTETGNDITVSKLNYKEVETVVIPSTFNGKQVTTLASDLFKDSNLKSITFEGEIGTIGERCFKNCTQLKNVKFVVKNHKSATIKDYAFENCSSLEEIVLPETGYMFASYNFMFKDCINLKKIQINASTTPNANNFYNCPSLEEVINPTSTAITKDNCILSSDGKKLLLGWKNLDIPSTVTTISDYAYCNGSLVDQDYTIPSTVTSIGKCAFSNINIKSITLPSLGNVTPFIGELLFQYSTIDRVNWNYQIFYSDSFGDALINTIYIGKDVVNHNNSISVGGSTYHHSTQYVISVDNIIVDSNNTKFYTKNYILVSTASSDTFNAYMEYGHKEEYYLPNEITSLSSALFYKNQNVKKIVMRDNVNYMARPSDTTKTYVIYDCPNLEELTLSQGFNSGNRGTLGSGCFSKLPKLKSLTIPKNLTNIYYDRENFNELDGLETIAVTSGNTALKVVGNILFTSSNVVCLVANNFYFSSTTPTAIQAKFANKNPRDKNIVLPTGSMSTDSILNWNTCESIEFPSSSKNLINSQIVKCENLKKLIMYKLNGFNFTKPGLGLKAFIDLPNLEDFRIQMTKDAFMQVLKNSKKVSKAEDLFSNCPKLKGIKFYDTTGDYYVYYDFAELIVE